MSHFFSRILDWSEVWAILIPLITLQLKRGQSPSLKPVIIYVWLAFLINLAIDVIMTVNIYFKNDFLSNNPLYNIHSVIRFICFCSYFIIIQPGSFRKVKKTIAALAALFLIFNFLFAEKFFNYESFSGNLHATEAYLYFA
jgi:glucan phosphoethanolaminetransferase (alkaline phosphatase superfamily)